MERRVLVVESGSELAPLVSEGVAALDPAVEVEVARSLNGAVARLAERAFDLIVSAEELGGARAGLFLRHLCERRFPAVPFLLLADASDEARHEARRRLERLLLGSAPAETPARASSA